MELPGLSKGNYLLKAATPEGDVETSLPIELEENRSLEVSLEAGQIEGLVVDRATGVAVAGAEVAMTPLAVSGLRARTLRTRDDGTFASGRLMAGRYLITVRVGGRGDASMEVEVAAGGKLSVTLSI